MGARQTALTTPNSSEIYYSSDGNPPDKPGWRICFRFDDGDAFEVQVCDYH